MRKRIMVLMLSLLMLTGLGTTAFAAEAPEMRTQAPNVKTVESENVTVLNDPALIAKNEELPDAVPALFGLTLKNRVRVGEGYYMDEPFLVDNIQGPMQTGPEIEFESKSTAGFNGECGVSKGDIKAAFGVNFSHEETVTRTYKFDPIPAGKRLVYEAYVNYTIYEFEVYSGSIYLGKSQYWVPVGIVVRHHLS